MNSAQIHLALNHFPIAGTILAFLVLMVGLIVKKDQVKMVGIGLLLIGTISGVIVASSGDGAEEIVEHKPLVTKGLIHEHEEAADGAMVALYLSSALGIAWLAMYKMKKNHLEKVFYLMLLTNLVSSLMVANAAHKGGQIRHDEIRDGVK